MIIKSPQHFSVINAALAFCIRDLQAKRPFTDEDVASVLEWYGRDLGIPMRRLVFKTGEYALRVGDEGDLDAVIVRLGIFKPFEEQKMALAA